jgi:hypothetical protein
MKGLLSPYDSVLATLTEKSMPKKGFRGRVLGARP